jgi:hypothetical protein
VSTQAVPDASAIKPNGSGAAAILAAAIGSFAVGLFGFAADKSSSAKTFFVFYKPTGQLSGETTLAVLVWLAVWAILNWRWRRRTVAFSSITLIAFVLLGLSLLLTFPPLSELL